MALRVFLVSAGVVLANVVLYTAYSKKSRKLEWAELRKVVTGSEGLDHSLVELNKVSGLAGFTNLSIAFLPVLQPAEQRGLLFVAMSTLWAHASYSVYRFYGQARVPTIGSYPSIFKELVSPNSNARLQGIRRLSVISGVSGQLALLAAYFGAAPSRAVAIGAVALGTVHFYTMEVDTALRLQVRPFGYLPFPLAGLAIGALLFAP